MSSNAKNEKPSDKPIPVVEETKPEKEKAIPKTIFNGWKKKKFWKSIIINESRLEIRDPFIGKDFEQ